MPLTPAVLLGVIVLLAIVAHSSASTRVTTLPAFAVVLCLLFPIGAVFLTLGSGASGSSGSVWDSLNPLAWFYLILRPIFRTLHRVVSMNPVNFLLVLDVAYLVLQPTLLVAMRGRWRVAAAVPLPFVVVPIVGTATEGTGNLGPLPLLFLLPPAAGYLLVLLVLWTMWKAVRRLEQRLSVDRPNPAGGPLPRSQGS